MAEKSRMMPVAVAILIMGIALILVPPTIHLSQPVHGANRSISLVGNINGWNYSAAANPAITVTQGDVVTISLTSVDYTHQFALDSDGVDGQVVKGACPSGDTCSGTFGPSNPTSIKITVSLGPGTYEYFCTFHTAMVGNFIVNAAPPTPDYSIARNPAALTIVQGSSGTSTITVSSLNGFSGTVNLSASVSPAGSTSPTASLKPTSVAISSGNSMTSTLSVNSTTSTPSGSYTVTVTASNATTSHQTSVSVTINPTVSQDFSISSSPTSLNIASGSIGTTTITLIGLGGFSGTVTLTGSVSPSGPSVSFSPPSVTVSGGSATSTMTVSAVGGSYSTIATGNYSVNVTASSGTLSHSTTVQVTVGSANPGSSLGSIPVTVLIGVVVVIAAAVVVTVLLLRRKAK